MRDHRRFADAPWALPAERVDRIEEQLRRFQGTDTAQDLAWLFANYVELPDPGSRDAAAEQQAVAQRQEEAVRDLIADGGIATCRWLSAQRGGHSPITSAVRHPRGGFAPCATRRLPAVSVRCCTSGKHLTSNSRRIPG